MKKELLEKMRKTFQETYAQTPEEAGYKYIHQWDDSIVLAKDRAVFEALINCQVLIRKSIIQFCIYALFLLTAIIICSIISVKSTHEYVSVFTCIWIGLVAISVIICTIINHKRHLLYEHWESIYTKNSSHLIFDEKSGFFAIEKEPNYPETAFF